MASKDTAYIVKLIITTFKRNDNMKNIDDSNIEKITLEDYIGGDVDPDDINETIIGVCSTYDKAVRILKFFEINNNIDVDTTKVVRYTYNHDISFIPCKYCTTAPNFTNADNEGDRSLIIGLIEELPMNFPIISEALVDDEFDEGDMFDDGDNIFDLPFALYN